MRPLPDYDARTACGRLRGRTAIITGGDSGIGRAVAVAFAAEGADVAIVYLREHSDAKETQRIVEEQGRRCVLLAGDVGREPFCRRAAERTARELRRIDIVVNNAAEQHPKKSLAEIDARQLLQTFRSRGRHFRTCAGEARSSTPPPSPPIAGAPS
jgi:NAD(P)-dependent dehydrogenase (short-subunit alcohol dehydrogenase family)